MMRLAYDGLVAASAWWHSLGVHGPLELDAPVRTPLMVILDHLIFGLAVGRGVEEVSLSLLWMIALIWGAASWRECGVAFGPPVTTRLPFVVHLTAANDIWGGEIWLSPRLMVLQAISGLGRSSLVIPRCARSTTRLGLGGLDPATAE